MDSANDSDHLVFRAGGISYLRIPVRDAQGSATFYHAVFGWTVDQDRFAGGTGHVIGHWAPDLPVVGEAGVMPYVCVTDLDEALAKVTDNGGAVTTQPYREGDLRVATFRDPAGNVLGAWQRARQA